MRFEWDRIATTGDTSFAESSQHAGVIAMSARSSKKKRTEIKTTLFGGRMDVDRMRNMTEEEIERTSPPELRNLPKDFWKDAKLVPPVIKHPISIRLDPDVLAWFRTQGPGYQSRINAVLRAYVKAMRAKR